MTSKTFCDLCHREVKKYSRNEPYVYLSIHPTGPTQEICESCWTDKKRWLKIHKVEFTKDY